MSKRLRLCALAFLVTVLGMKPTSVKAFTGCDACDTPLVIPPYTTIQCDVCLSVQACAEEMGCTYDFDCEPYEAGAVGVMLCPS